MEIRIIPHSFSVCKIKDTSCIDLSAKFTFTAVTDEEISLVCPTELVPARTECREDGWQVEETSEWETSASGLRYRFLTLKKEV